MSKKISELITASSLTGTELVEVVQSSTNKKTTTQAIANLAGITDGDKGDITVSASGATWTIDNDAVNYAKMQNISAASKLIGRGDSGAGDPEEITLGTGLIMTGTTLSVSGGGISGLTTNRIPYATSATTLGDDSELTWNATNDALTIGVARIHATGSASNLFFGQSSGNFSVSGSFNIGFGTSTLQALTSGTNNTAIGYASLQNILDGDFNTALGYQALNQLTTSNGNIGIGYKAGDNITTGSTNIIIGHDIDAQSATTSNQLSIQNIIFGTGNSATGTTVSTGLIGIGIAAPSGKLHVVNSGSESTIQADKYSGDAGNPDIQFRKSRGTSTGTFTVVQNGDDLGRITFLGSDGTNFEPGAQIRAEITGTPGNNDMPCSLIFETTPDGSASLQERMIILPDGNIGITVGAPTRKLEVGGSLAIRAGSSTGQIVRVGGVIQTDTTTTGNVGAGEDTLQTYSVPADTLDVNKDALAGTYAGTFGASLNNKRLRLKFGGTTIFDSGALAITAATDWVLEFEIIRTGATTQKCNARLNTSSAALTAYADYSTASETLSGTVTLLLTGEATADNDIVKETFKLRWEPSE